MASNSSEKQPLLESQQEPAPQPTLSELQQNVFKAQREYMKAWSRTTSGKVHRRIMFGVTALLLTFAVFAMVIIAQDELSEEPWRAPHRVPLEAHIMSKCPDARDCLRDMILPAMQNISHDVDFKLSYIGKITHHDDGVECMHGPQECLGNIVELCAAKLYPDPKIWLGFTWCLTRDYEKIADQSLVEDCALEHGMSFDKLNHCIVDEDGTLVVDELQESFNRSAAAGVTKSCTIRLDGKVRCIRDGGEWTDCEGGHTAEDLVADIKAQVANSWDENVV